MQISESNHWILNLPCYTSTLKTYGSSFHEIYKVITFEYETSFLKSFFTMKFITPKFMKIRCSSFLCEDLEIISKCR
jgi:hypothetical protein